MKDYSSSLPTTIRTFDIGFGGGMVNIRRVGDMVFVAAETSYMTVGDGTTYMTETIPTGYRPIFGSVLVMNTMERSRDFRIQISNDGSMVAKTIGGYATGVFIAHGVWITNDPWPTS